MKMLKLSHQKRVDISESLCRLPKPAEWLNVMVWNKTPEFCVLTIRLCMMGGREKNKNLVRNYAE